MAEGKYCKIGGAIRQITSEYTKIGGVIRQGTVNYPKVGGVIKPIPVGEKLVFVCEQFSDLLYAIDDTPTVITGWPESGGGIVDPRDVAHDGNNGYVYFACANNVYCLDEAGTIQWTYTGHTSPVTAICVDYNGRVYTGDFGGTTKMIESFPGIGPGYSVAWSQNIGANYAVYALAIDVDENWLFAGTGFAKDAVYGCTAHIGNWTLRYTSLYGDITGLAIDEDIPSLYVGTGNGYLMKMGTNGYVYWGDGGAIATNVYAVRVGHDGYGYAATGLSKGLLKFTLSTGGTIWHSVIGGTASAVGCAVDEYGNVYGTFRVAGTSTDNAVRKVNSSGTEQWGGTGWQPYTSAQFYGIAVSPGIKAAGFD